MALKRFAGSEVFNGSALHVDTYAVARFDEGRYPGHFKQREPDLMTVPVKGSREQIGQYRSYTCCLQRFRGQGPSGGAAEIAARHDNVARLNLNWKIRICRFENMLGHLRDALQHDVSRGDQVCRNVVAELPTVAFKNRLSFHFVEQPISIAPYFLSGRAKTYNAFPVADG